MKKKIVLATVAALLILAVCVCTLPWPTHFEYTFFGTRVDADGTVIEEGTITLSGTRYTYLLKDPQIRLTNIVMPGFEVLSMDYKVPILTRADPGYERISSFVYVKETDQAEVLDCLLAADQQTCVLTVGKRTFAGSTEPDFDPQALIEYCVN